MSKKIFKYKKGFTLIELLLVIAILSLLASIILVVTSLARVKAANAQILSQAGEYVKSFAVQGVATGNYPDPGDTTNYYCLGKTSSQNCTFWGSSITGNDTIQTAISPVIKSSAIISPVSIDGLAYDNIVYKCTGRSNGVCTNPALYYPQANTTACRLGTIVVSGSGGIICGINADGLGIDNVEIGNRTGIPPTMPSPTNLTMITYTTLQFNYTKVAGLSSGHQYFEIDASRDNVSWSLISYLDVTSLGSTGSLTANIPTIYDYARVKMIYTLDNTVPGTSVSESPYVFTPYF